MSKVFLLSILLIAIVVLSGCIENGAPVGNDGMRGDTDTGTEVAPPSKTIEDYGVVIPTYKLLFIKQVWDEPILEDTINSWYLLTFDSADFGDGWEVLSTDRINNVHQGSEAGENVNYFYGGDEVRITKQIVTEEGTIGPRETIKIYKIVLDSVDLEDMELSESISCGYRCSKQTYLIKQAKIISYEFEYKQDS
jgi:hypothetical protein